MLTTIHFFSCYLLGVFVSSVTPGAFWSAPTTSFVAIAGILPDLDAVTIFGGRDFYKKGHATYTHTLIAAFILAPLFAVLWWIFWCPVWRREKYGAFPRLVFVVALAFLAYFSHLFLDLWTWDNRIPGDGQPVRHMYCWPAWHKSFHMNTLWPGVFSSERKFLRVLFEGIMGGFIIGAMLHELLCRRWPWKPFVPYVTVSFGLVRKLILFAWRANPFIARRGKTSGSAAIELTEISSSKTIEMPDKEEFEGVSVVRDSEPGTPDSGWETCSL